MSFMTLFLSRYTSGRSLLGVYMKVFSLLDTSDYEADLPSQRQNMNIPLGHWTNMSFPVLFLHLIIHVCLPYPALSSSVVFRVLVSGGGGRSFYIAGRKWDGFLFLFLFLRFMLVPTSLLSCRAIMCFSFFFVTSFFVLPSVIWGGTT